MKKYLKIPVLVTILTASVLLSGCGREEPDITILPEELQYRTILFKDMTAKSELDEDSRDHRIQAISKAIAHLTEMQGFETVANYNENMQINGPALVVETHLTEHRIVSAAGRMWGGAFAGSSYMHMETTIRESGINELVAKDVLSTENSAYGAAWTGGRTDAEMPLYMGVIIADFVAEKAKK